MNSDPDDCYMETSDVPHDDFDEPTDEEDIELDAINLYQEVDMEADIDLDHRDALEDADHDPHPDDFCQTVSDTMALEKSLFFEVEDGVLRRGHPSIPEL